MRCGDLSIEKRTFFHPTFVQPRICKCFPCTISALDRWNFPREEPYLWHS